MLVSSSEDGATFKNTVGSLPDSGSEDDKGITTKARDNFSGNKDEGSYVNPLDDEELQRTIENSGDETKLSQYIVDLASKIFDEKIPEGVNQEDYKKFVKTEIIKNAREMAREYFEERVPVAKSILKYIREKRKDFISKYRGTIRDSKIKELSQKINELERLISIGKTNTTTPPSTPPSEPLSMEGGRKKKRKKRTKRKSRKKYKKTKKYR